MFFNRLRDYLDENKIKYVVINHTETFTAQETAQTSHISGKEVAKTVMIKLDGKPAMVVLRAPDTVNLDRIRKASGAKHVQLAGEKDFSELFPDCEVGAMPPFGNLYGIEVFAEKILSHDREIAFNAGTHRELVKMDYRDFERLVKPKEVAF